MASAPRHQDLEYRKAQLIWKNTENVQQQQRKIMLSQSVESNEIVVEVLLQIIVSTSLLERSVCMNVIIGTVSSLEKWSIAQYDTVAWWWRFFRIYKYISAYKINNSILT